MRHFIYSLAIDVFIATTIRVYKHQILSNRLIVQSQPELVTVPGRAKQSAGIWAK
jgi:hypothetical protein